MISGMRATDRSNGCPVHDWSFRANSRLERAQQGWILNFGRRRWQANAVASTPVAEFAPV
jgi:hypothetical protein